MVSQSRSIPDNSEDPIPSPPNAEPNEAPAAEPPKEAPNPANGATIILSP